MDCLFCKIARKELPSDVVYEDETFLVFRDIKPKASFHVLLIPKRHIESIDHVELQDKALMGEMILTCQKVARASHLPGYRIAINVGKKGGQEIDHLHLHILADSL